MISLLGFCPASKGYFAYEPLIAQDNRIFCLLPPIIMITAVMLACVNYFQLSKTFTAFLNRIGLFVANNIPSLAFGLAAMFVGIMLPYSRDVPSAFYIIHLAFKVTQQYSKVAA